MDRMTDTDTGARALRYKPIVVAIHWISALLIIGQIAGGLWFADMPKGPERAQIFTLHKSFGVLILLLAVARLIVRLMNPPPPFPEEMPKWKRIAAVWNHRAFYFLLFALPLTGQSLVAEHAKGGLTKLAFGIPWPVISLGPIGEAHVLLAFTMIGLIVLHVGAALEQQFVERTIVADRMPPFHSGKARLD